MVLNQWVRHDRWNTIWAKRSKPVYNSSVVGRRCENNTQEVETEKNQMKKRDTGFRLVELYTSNWMRLGFQPWASHYPAFFLVPQQGWKWPSGTESSTIELLHLKSCRTLPSHYSNKFLKIYSNIIQLHIVLFYVNTSIRVHSIK